MSPISSTLAGASARGYGGLGASVSSAVPGTYESIATATVGNAGATSVLFASIPQTFTHLEVRATMLNASNFYTIKLRFNGDTGSNYTASQIASVISSMTGGGPDNDTGAMIGLGARNDAYYSSAIVAKVYEYKAVNLYKRWLAQGGADGGNNTGQTKLTFGYWANTAAITDITCYADGSTMNQFTQFALYGIKGA